MISLPLDELYLSWLYSQVAEIDEESPRRTHWGLLKQLYKTEFIWLIPNDDNRVADGKELRYEFLEEHGFHEVDREWMELGCSFLEMLIGLSRRLCFEAGGSDRGWFWHLIRTLDIHRYTDDRRIPSDRIEDILNTVIWRTYDRDGTGGLFPLRHSRRDQRRVELWYQMNSFLIEND